MRPDTQKAIETAQARSGFLTEADLEHIAQDPETRLTLLLVRCSAGRFLAPAQDVQHFVSIIDAGGRQPEVRADKNPAQFDYVRDVSLPADFEIAGDPPRQQWPTTPETLKADQQRRRLSGDPARPRPDYGGVDDQVGHVFSDADPGL